MDNIYGTIMTVLPPSDWLSITSIAVSAIGIAVSAMVAIWIVDTLQKRFETRHQLKDHFSKEVLTMREQYRQLVRDLIGTEQKPKQIMSNFKMTGIYANDLLTLLNSQFDTPTDILLPFQTELYSIATESEEFNNAYSRNRKFQFRKATIEQIHEFEKKHDRLFNDILMSIYDERK